MRVRDNWRIIKKGGGSCATEGRDRKIEDEGKVIDLRRIQ